MLERLKALLDRSAPKVAQLERAVDAARTQLAIAREDLASERSRCSHMEEMKEIALERFHVERDRAQLLQSELLELTRRIRDEALPLPGAEDLSEIVHPPSTREADRLAVQASRGAKPPPAPGGRG